MSTGLLSPESILQQETATWVTKCQCRVLLYVTSHWVPPKGAIIPTGWPCAFANKGPRGSKWLSEGSFIPLPWFQDGWYLLWGLGSLVEVKGTCSRVPVFFNVRSQWGSFTSCFVSKLSTLSFCLRLPHLWEESKTHSIGETVCPASVPITQHRWDGVPPC